MLKLVALPLVNQIAVTRDELMAKAADVAKGEFVVTIGGREREDAELRRQIRPVLQQVLRARVAQLEDDLASFGVDVDAA